MTAWSLPDWHDRALCNDYKRPRGMSLSWIHDEEHPNADRARDICDACPVRELCLQDALDDSESQGIRGGFRFHYGRLVDQESIDEIRLQGFTVHPRRDTPSLRYHRKEDASWQSESNDAGAAA